MGAATVWTQELFNEWVRTYRPAYGRRQTIEETDEWIYRLGVFRANLKFFDSFNEQHTASTGITQGITPFADQTEHEWAERFNGLRSLSPTAEADLTTPFVPQSDFVAPVAVDWRNATSSLPNGAVTPVKSQGKCGGCWDFAAVAALEGRNAIATGKLTALSEQEVLDCCNTTTGPHPCWGCKGGAAVYAYLWIKDNGGLDSEADYP